MMLKDNNFISAVVYLHNDGARAVEFCRTVAAELDANFKQYELVVVDDACTDDTVKQLRAWGREQDAPLTILHMSIYHGLEDAMNAGLDAAIGDYVYEFDSTELCYAPTLIMQAYRAASGLRMVDLEFDGQLTVKQKGRFNLALDSLTLYTNFGFKASVTVTLCMMALALAELIYTLVIFATGHPVEGWTTTMFVITVGFAGLFAVLTIIVKWR